MSGSLLHMNPDIRSHCHGKCCPDTYQPGQNYCSELVPHAVVGNPVPELLMLYVVGNLVSEVLDQFCVPIALNHEILEGLFLR